MEQELMPLHHEAQETLNALTAERMNLQNIELHAQRNREVTQAFNMLFSEAHEAGARTNDDIFNYLDPQRFTLQPLLVTPREAEEKLTMVPLTAARTTEETDDPPFVLQMNLQDIELRALREQQPIGMLARDYQLPIAQALQTERRRLTAYIQAATKAKRVAETVRLLMNNGKAHYINIFKDMYTRSQLLDMQQEDFDVSDMGVMQDCFEVVGIYRARKKEFLKDKQRYAPMQALYNQQVARIRQKPRTTTIIDIQRIIDIVSQWENVWGIRIQRHNNYNGDTLTIRVGLCDIGMEESAPETCFSYAADILLAPFYFTISLSTTGTFICSSQNGDTRGLSRGNNQGGMSYDIHPHQLSDSPCFGSFGQSFVDMARVGDMVSLIGGIIAFYSQYNSEDSAGVNAYQYHPANLVPPNNEYPTALITHFNNGRLADIDETKLTEAFNRYMEYHDLASREDPPTLNNTNFCYSCDENPVSDNDEFWISNSGDRICQPCWDNNYCHDCERHNDDCECHDES